MTDLDPTRLPRSVKRAIMVAGDMLLIPLALWSAFALRFGNPFPKLGDGYWLLLLAPVVSIPIFIRLGLYRAVVRFMGGQVVLAVLKGVTLSALILAAAALLLHLSGIPRSVFIIYWGAAFIYVAGSRFLVRSWYHTAGKARNRARVAVYGTGNSGVQLATALANGREFKLAAFIDDNRSLWGSAINGIRVYGPDEIERLVEERGVGQVLLAMPTLSHAKRRAIVDRLEPLPVQVRTIPGISDLVTGKARVDEIREIDIEDLLGRDSVMPDRDLLERSIRGKSVLVTGAGGSIGSELCRQVLELAPARLVLFEIAEFQLYRIERELLELVQAERLSVDVVPVLGSVLDSERVGSVLTAFGVHTVFHAAAYKHVPLVEHNVLEGVRNNTIGTWRAAEAALAAGVERFVLISTDKAVRPTNVMGASKRFAELALQGLAGESAITRFCMVRFGNVLGSSGSVVPLFREQIRNGGPVTVTHPEVIRYFMTIPEAAQLVIQAGAMARGGEVYLLDMGEPVRIIDLAKKMIHLAGYEERTEENPDGDIAIEFTGLRPGEKLYEELLIGDNPEGTGHPRIMQARERTIPWPEMLGILSRLESLCTASDAGAVRDLLREVVDGYQPGGRVEDVVWLQVNGGGEKPLAQLPKAAESGGKLVH